MVQVLRLLRRLPVAQKIEDIAIFINRELLPFLQELRESTAATFEQVTTNTLLGRDSPGTGDIEEISLDDTLELTGSKVIQRAAITGDVTIPAGSNVSTVPALTGILSDISALEAAEYITYSSNSSLANERVLTSGTNTLVDISVANQAKINVDNYPLSGVEDIAAKSIVTNATNSVSAPTALAGLTARHVPRINDANTAVEWENPLEFNIDGIDQGDVYGIDVVGGRGSVTSGVGEINLLFSQVSQTESGTVNALVLPASLVNKDTFVISPNPSNVILNGIDVQDSLGNDWPIGFEFVLINNLAGTTITINDESGSASAVDRISNPRDQQIVLGQSASVIIRRYNSRWGLVERGWPDASTSIVYSGFELRRAALTGFAAASANSNATTSAEPIVTYSASSNMSEERVLSAGTNTAVDVSVANQIRINVAASNALIPDGDKGDITVSSTGSTWTVDNDVITPAKLSHGPIGSQLVSFGSFADPMWCHVMTEHFFGPLGDARFIGTGWVWNTAGSMNVTERPSEQGHPGVRRFGRPSGAGTGLSFAYVAQTSTSELTIDISDVAYLYFNVKIPSEATQAALTSRRFVIGLVQDAADLDGTGPDLGGNGLVLWKLNTSGNWFIRDENASAATTTTTNSAVLGEWVECLMVNEGSGNWGIQVNGTDHGTHSGVATSGMMMLAIGIETTSVVDAFLDVDEISIGFLSSVNRFG